MFDRHGRQALFGALLVTALSAPAFANDGVTTTQRTSAGQLATEVAFLQTSPTIVEEGYATETYDRVAAPGTRPAARREPLPPRPTVRQHTPLILGIGY